MTVRYDFSDLPREFTDYMFDQLTDVGDEFESGNVCRQLRERTDIDDGSVIVGDTAVGIALQRLYEEKHAQIETAIANDERDDYSYLDLIDIRENVLGVSALETQRVVTVSNDELNTDVHDKLCDSIDTYLTNGYDNEWFAFDYDAQTATVSTLLVETVLDTATTVTTEQ